MASVFKQYANLTYFFSPACTHASSSIPPLALVMSRLKLPRTEDDTCFRQVPCRLTCTTTFDDRSPRIQLWRFSLWRHAVTYSDVYWGPVLRVLVEPVTLTRCKTASVVRPKWCSPCACWQHGLLFAVCCQTSWYIVFSNSPAFCLYRFFVVL